MYYQMTSLSLFYKPSNYLNNVINQGFFLVKRQQLIFTYTRFVFIKFVFIKECLNVCNIAEVTRMNSQKKVFQIKKSIKKHHYKLTLKSCFVKTEDYNRIIYYRYI